MGRDQLHPPRKRWRLHFSAISFLLPVYVMEGEKTPVELPVALPVFVYSDRDPVKDFPVELLRWCSGSLHTPSWSPVSSIAEQGFPCHETDSQFAGNLFPTPLGLSACSEAE